MGLIHEVVVNCCPSLPAKEFSATTKATKRVEVGHDEKAATTRNKLTANSGNQN